MDGAWVLAGLVRQSAALVKVHTLSTWRPSIEMDMTDLSGLSQHLRQHGNSRGGSHQRLNMALPSHVVHEGFIDFPSELPEEDWLYEVQLDVAQALQLAPDEVNFDFEPSKASDGLVRRVHWVGCSQTQMAAFKDCIRAAGWRLAAVEIEQQAAQRAVRALKGGSVSLLTQAPQDWQFQLDRVALRPLYESAEPSEESDDTIAQALEPIMRTPGGARLVAAGLALKAWH
jgi:Tfp pilus assembly PilM family ATPase